VAYGPVLLKLRELGYKGYIGAECFPKDKDDLKAASDLASLAKIIELKAPFL
jgi:hydroxypyruvate isomerase